LNQLANAAVALQQTGVLLGNGNFSDSVILSPEALNALVLQSNPSQNDTGSADYFTQAVNNELTNNVNSAVNTFLPANNAQSGTNINVVG
jgi:hypothetical protein